MAAKKSKKPIAAAILPSDLVPGKLYFLKGAEEWWWVLAKEGGEEEIVAWVNRLKQNGAVTSYTSTKLPHCPVSSKDPLMFIKRIVGHEMVEGSGERQALQFLCGEKLVWLRIISVRFIKENKSEFKEIKTVQGRR